MGEALDPPMTLNLDEGAAYGASLFALRHAFRRRSRWFCRSSGARPPPSRFALAAARAAKCPCVACRRRRSSVGAPKRAPRSAARDAAARYAHNTGGARGRTRIGALHARCRGKFRLIVPTIDDPLSTSCGHPREPPRPLSPGYHAYAGPLTCPPARARRRAQWRAAGLLLGAAAAGRLRLGGCWFGRRAAPPTSLRSDARSSSSRSRATDVGVAATPNCRKASTRPCSTGRTAAPMPPGARARDRGRLLPSRGGRNCCGVAAAAAIAGLRLLGALGRLLAVARLLVLPGRLRALGRRAHLWRAPRASSPLPPLPPGAGLSAPEDSNTLIAGARRARRRPIAAAAGVRRRAAAPRRSSRARAARCCRVSRPRSCGRRPLGVFSPVRHPASPSPTPLRKWHMATKACIPFERNPPSFGCIGMSFDAVTDGPALRDMCGPTCTPLLRRLNPPTDAPRISDGFQGLLVEARRVDERVLEGVDQIRVLPRPFRLLWRAGMRSVRC